MLWLILDQLQIEDIEE